jgi:hypothetical protein
LLPCTRSRKHFNDSNSFLRRAGRTQSINTQFQFFFLFEDAEELWTLHKLCADAASSDHHLTISRTGALITPFPGGG